MGGRTMNKGAFSTTTEMVCHPELVEGSSLNASQILRFAQNDRAATRHLFCTSYSDSDMMVGMDALAQRGTARYLHDRHRALQFGGSRRQSPGLGTADAAEWQHAVTTTAKGYRRDAWSTRRQGIAGGTPAPLLAATDTRIPPIRFCETNPPILECFFDAIVFRRDTYDGNMRENSVGSFWKTNPIPGGK